MTENDGALIEDDEISGEAHSEWRDSEQNGPDDLTGALKLLKPEKPLMLNDGLWVTDSGYLVSSQYVDIGPTKWIRRPRVLVKAIEAQYALEYAPSLQISAPHRFRDYGETFIQDEQEGRAQRVNKTESEPRSYEESTREQERALALLGRKGATISETEMPGGESNSESLVFGGSSWIFCTSMISAPGERDAWRATLPGKYDHESTIRQPGKFALALAAMFAEQTGPQGRHGYFTHHSGIRSYHPGLLIYHGPVWYTDDVLDFLKSFKSDPLYTMYPLFVKDSQYRNQREYRFVLHSERPVEGETLRLHVSGMMRDALTPPRSTGAVVFGQPEDSDAGSSPKMAVTATPGNKTTTRTTQTGKKQRRILRVGDQVEEEEIVSREEVMTLTTVAPAVGSEEAEDGGDSALPGVAEVAQTENREQWIRGERVDSMSYSRTRVFSIKDTTGADEHFSIEDRDRAAEFLEVVGRPFEKFSDLPPLVIEPLMTLARKAQDAEPDTEVQVMSACWNGVWAICNLYECFGDVVASVDIEQAEFVAIVLKDPADSGVEGKILVGPRGTYAYVLTRGEERHLGHGGTKTRLAFFPDNDALATFEEFGWSSSTGAKQPDDEPAA